MAKGFFSDKELSEGGDNTMSGELIEWGNETMEALRDALRKSVSSGTSKQLEQSIVVLPLEISGSKMELNFRMEDYWKFIDKGVQGKGGKRADGGTWTNKASGSPFRFKDKKPPLSQGSGLSQWAHNKGINPFAAREAIYRQGIRATKFYSNTIDESRVNELVLRLEKAGAKEIEITLSISEQ